MNTFIHVDSFNGEKTEVDLIIKELDFLEEVKACSSFKGSFSITTIGYLRSIAIEFGRRYDKYFNSYRNVNPHDFQGIPFKTDEDVAKIVKQMFMASYPQYLQSFLESKIKNRFFNCENIIVIGFNADLVNSTMNKFSFTKKEITSPIIVIPLEQDTTTNTTNNKKVKNIIKNK